MKISNFGIVKVRKSKKTSISRIVRTSDYMSPELLKNDYKIYCKVDV